MEQLYLFEILIRNLSIQIDDKKVEIKNLNKVKITVTCNNFVNIDIEAKPENIDKVEKQSAPEDTSTYDVGFYTGKSCLLPSRASNLTGIFELQEIVLKVLTSNDGVSDIKPDSGIILGTRNIKWPKGFIALAKESENPTGKINSVNIADQFDIFDETKTQLIGTVNIYLCLHCFGKNIQVDFQLLNVNVDVTEMKNRLIKVNPDGQKEGEIQEWLPLFKSPHKERFSRIDPELRIFAEVAGILIPDTPEFVEELTPDYINKNLCGKKVCPGAIKFKEYGLGPLSTPINTAGLGTIYNNSYNTTNNIKPHGIYGLSQTYGNLDHYGAFGLLRNTKINSNISQAQQQKPEKGKDTNFYKTKTINKEDRHAETCGGETCPYVYLPRQLEVVKKLDSLASNSQKSINKNTNSKSFIKICCCKPPSFKAGFNSMCTKCMHSKSDKRERKSKCNSQSDKYHQINTQNGFRLAGGSDKQPSGYWAKEFNKNKYADVNFDNYSDRICPLSPGRHQNKKFSFQDNNTTRPLGQYQPKYGNNVNTNMDQDRNLCHTQECPALSKQPMQQNFDYPNPSNMKHNFNDERMSTSTKYSFGNYDDGKRGTNYSNRSGLKPQSYSINIDSNLSLSNITNLYMIAQNRHMSQSMNNYCDLGSNSSYQRCPSNKRRLSSNMAKTKYETDTSFLYDQLIDLRADLPSDDSFSNQIPMNSSANSTPTTSVKQKSRKPCDLDSCKLLNYKATCSECGGISRSGATCDNKYMTSPSYTTISYDGSFTNDPDDDPHMAHVQNENNVSSPPVPPTTPILSKSPEDKERKKSNNKNDGGGRNLVKIKEASNKKTRFVYHAGEYYSGIRVGHKMCLGGGKNVPADMGWLWNVDAPGLKRRRGWRPGVLSKIINDKIIQRRQELGIPNPPELKMLVRKTKVPKHREEEEEYEEEIEPKPTLIIQKKEGCYLITMNPLKDPKTIEENENPYMNCAPMQFFITKNKSAKSNEKAAKDSKNETDTTNRNKNECLCDENLRSGENEDEDESDSSDSELNIEFTTPAGIILPEKMKKKPNEVYTETQFKEDDINCESCSIIMAKTQRTKKAVKLKLK